jgi:putative GTP pyrophosphokinase
VDTKKLIRTLDAISYETKLGKNLKNTLRKVDKDLLMDELNDYRLFLKKRRRLLDQYTYRIKSLQSIKLKYDRYYPTKEIGTCFNDILGIRIIVLDYDINLSN